MKTDINDISDIKDMMCIDCKKDYISTSLQDISDYEMTTEYIDFIMDLITVRLDIVNAKKEFLSNQEGDMINVIEYLEFLDTLDDILKDDLDDLEESSDVNR